MTQKSPIVQRLSFSKEWLWVLVPISVFLIFLTLLPCWILEDGYIMLRYARNIAYGFGVVYNPGDAPVWGCTSMLTTVTLAAMIRAGLVPEMASAVLGIITGISLIVLVFCIERKILGLGTFPSVASCCILAISQLVSLALMGFDVLLFTFMMTLLFGVSLWAVLGSRSKNPGVPLPALSVVAILLSLTRPEGALVSVSTLVVVMWLRRDLSRLMFFLRVILPYIVVIALFYTWTIFYFGWPLPNPFYVKTGDLLIYPSAILVLGFFMLHYIAPITIVALWIHSVDRQVYRSLFILTIPALLYTLAYFAINQIQNIELRFQFPTLPILLIYFAQALAFFQPQLFVKTESLIKFGKRDRLTIAVVVLLIIAFVQPAVYRGLTLPWGEHPDALYVGQSLHAYRNNGYTMVVSEAGGIPFYADWHTIDAFGLNDPVIAHYGLTNDYLAVLDPEIIMFNQPWYTEDTPEWASSTDPWDVMCRTLYLYAESHNYTLACIYRVYLQMDGVHYPYGNHWYYVRNNFTDSVAIISLLQSFDGLVYVYPTSVS
ncbi:MAG: hypothetical protein ACFE89_05550 [Candidatus Hodarchaeota archaeon]